MVKDMQTYNKQRITTNNWGIVWFSIVFAVLYWFIDCFTDVYIFKEGTLTSQIFSPYPHEIWMRLLTMFVLISLGILAQLIIASNKKIDSLIRESEQKHSMVVNNIDEIVYFVKLPEENSLEGTVQFVSDRVERILGYRPEEFIQDQGLWFRMIHPDDIPVIVEGTKDIFRNKRIDTRVYRLRHKSTGEYIWVEDRVTPQLDDSGKVTGIFGVARDITERKQTMADLKESEARYRNLFDNAHDLIQSVAPDGHIIYVNPAWLKTMGYTLEELRQMTIFDILHPDYKIQCMNTLKSVMSGVSKDNIEVVFISKDGRLINIEGSVSPHLVDGREVACNGVFRDITERNQAEKALRESEKLYKTLAEAADDMIYIIDREDNVRYVNITAAKQFGCKPEDLIGQKRRELFPPEIAGRQLEQLQKVFETGKSVYVEDKIVFLNRELWISASLVPISNEAGEVNAVMGVSRDITVSKKAEGRVKDISLQWQTTFNAMNDAIFIADAEGKILRCNKAFADLVKRQESEIVGRTCHEVVHGTADFIDGCPFITTKDTHQREVIELEAGSKWFSVTVDPVLNDSGEIISYVHAMTDITERRRILEALKESEEQYRLLFQYSPIGVFHYTNDLIVTECNKRFAEIVHLAPEQITGFDLKMLKVESVHSALNAAIKGEEGFYEGLCLLSPVPAETWVTLLTAPHFDRQGDIKGGIGIVEDITERKQTQETLSKITQTLQSLFKASPSAIIVLNVSGEVTMWGPAAERIFGWKAEEVLGRLNPIVPDEKQDEYKSFLKRILSGESLAGIEVRRLRKDGSYIYVLLSTAPVYDQNGSVTGIMGILTDIAEHKKAEEALRKSEENLKLYQALIDQSHDSVEVLDPETGYFLNVNKRTCSDLGYSREELLSMKVFDIDPMVKPSDFPKIVEDLRRTGGSIWSGVHLRKDGSTFPVEVSLRLVHLDRSYIVAVARDITERKKMEERIFQINQDWEDTFNIITDMITVHDKDFNIIRYNTAAEKILGLSFLNIKREKCYQFYHGTECPPAGCPSCLTFKTGVPATVEVFEPHLNMFIEIRAIPRLDSEHNIIGLIHVVRDITEHRKLENELRQSQKMEAVGQLAGGVAHDFNNIITAIIGYASIMKMKAGQDDYLRGLIDNVLSASEKAANLVRSLLAFSRKQASNLEPVKINDIIKSIEKLLSMAAGEDIELKIELTEDLIVTADIVQMEQVMMNLCTNARDAMDGRGTLIIKTGAAELTGDFIAAHGYGEEGRFALISVSDTGVGMDENTRERIFEPFFTTKEFGKGTGLGLSIVYGIVKQHKGYITCQSEPGKGTTFNIYLPVIKAAMKEVKRIEPSEPAGSAVTILFAEDEEKFRKLTRQMLESSGYNVIEAVDGADAVNKFKENNDIDLLLFDIIMPRMSGKEAYEKIRKIRPDVKALFISGYPADFTDRYGVFEEGMNFISKPVPPAALLRRIREALGNERAE